MTGSELETFCEEINGGASIGATDPFAAANTVAEQAADAEYAEITKQEAPEIVKKNTPPADIAA
jgi:hypothetical protein